VTLSIEDRLDTLELLTRADNAATARDAQAYVALFTEDGVIDGAEGQHRGREAMLASVGAIWAAEGPAGSHLTLNAIVEPVAGHPDQAVATSTLVIIVTGTPPVIRTAVQIVQHLVKVDGRWLICQRSVAGPDDQDPATS
jgi:uncharacterized protein (TIGR02246 family)